MERLDVLTNYLLQQKRISIPGLGTLHMERLPARTDFVNARILAPLYRFRFDQYFDAPDKDLFGYLSHHLGIPDFEAVKWYNEFAYSLRARIRNREGAVWPGLGSFVADEKGEITFETENPGFDQPEPVTARRVIREHTEHAVLVGDREIVVSDLSEPASDTVFVERGSWWIYALIIAALALISIGYHYFTQDAGMHSSGSQQKVPANQMPSTSRTINN
jgi:nucleoid DNA-binding protein